MPDPRDSQSEWRSIADPKLSRVIAALPLPARLRGLLYHAIDDYVRCAICNDPALCPGYAWREGRVEVGP